MRTLSELVFEEAIPGPQEAIVTRTRTTTWRHLRQQAEWIFRTQQAVASRRVGLVFRPAAESYAALTALDKLGCDVFLFDANLPLEQSLALATKLLLGGVLVGRDTGSPEFDMHDLPGEAKWSGSSSVTILTSGSTGEPKAAMHSWQTLGRPIRKGRGFSSPRWLLTFRPNLYAGLQVMLQCFADRGTLALPDLGMDASAVAEFMYQTRIQFVSATPSYWRRLLIFADPNLLKSVPLLQITLGGEVVDQPVLDKLKQYFPKARLVHIYATTELGRCFSVSDGSAGFPVSYLDTVLPDGIELRVCDGEILVRSPNAMRAYDPFSSHERRAGDWFATGDLVQISGERVYFAGRKSEVINVGGSKVHPLEVERVIRAIAGVSDVRVFGKRSSVAGELVACEIIPAPNHDAETLKATVSQVCRSRLASYQQPRVIKFVERIDLSSAGKTLRQGTS